MHKAGIENVPRGRQADEDTDLFAAYNKLIGDSIKPPVRERDPVVADSSPHPKGNRANRRKNKARSR